MTRLLFVLVLTSVNALATQPSTATAQASADITQGLWQWLRTEHADGSVLTALDPSKYTLTLQPDGRAALQVDCNRGSGTYTRQDQQLTFGAIATTLAACLPGPAGPSQESAFLDDLKNVASYRLDGDNLVLSLMDGAGSMIFQPRPPASLVASEWRVQSIGDGSGPLRPVLPDVPLTATFGDDDAVNGNAGCNSYRGQYHVVGSALTVGQVASTRRACVEQSLMEQENAFLTAMGDVASYSLVGDRLILLDGAGAQRLLLVRPTIQPTIPTSPEPGPGAAVSSPPAGPSSPAEAMEAGQPEPTEIRLPDGQTCAFAGTGATLAFEGKRLNYTCGDADAGSTVLLGEPVYDGGMLTVLVGTVQHTDNGFMLASSETRQIEVIEVVLADGLSCQSTGHGATLAFEGKRLNFSCGPQDVGLLGDLVTDVPTWMAERVSLERGPNGFSIASRETVGVRTVVGAQPAVS